MAAFDLYTTAGVLIYAQPRGPIFPVDAAPVTNTALTEAIGGKPFCEVWGVDRVLLRLAWDWVTAAHLASYLSWFATYGGGKAPCKIELPGDLTAYAAGTKMKVRCQDTRPRVAWVDIGHYALAMELLEEP